jgi:hypothetical protein
VRQLTSARAWSRITAVTYHHQPARQLPGQHCQPIQSLTGAPMSCFVHCTSSQQLPCQQLAGSCSYARLHHRPAAARSSMAAAGAARASAQRRHHSCTVSAQGRCSAPAGEQGGARPSVPPRAVLTRGNNSSRSLHPILLHEPCGSLPLTVDASLPCPLVMLRAGGASSVLPCTKQDASSRLHCRQTWRGILQLRLAICWSMPWTTS